MSKTIRLTGFILLVGLIVGCVSEPSKTTIDQADRPGATSAAETNMRLGLNYLEQGDYATALEKLNKSLEQDPTLASTHNTIALLYQQLNEMEKAEEHFKEAISLAPTYSEAYNNYGVFLCREARYTEAEENFLKAVENPLYEKQWHAYENAGLCAIRASDNIRADEYFRKALQDNPLSIKSILGLAQINYDEGYYPEAHDYLQRYRDVAPHSPRSLLLNIQVANKMGDKDAVASYSLYLRANFPDSEESHQVKKGQY